MEEVEHTPPEVETSARWREKLLRIAGLVAGSMVLVVTILWAIVCLYYWRVPAIVRIGAILLYPAAIGFMAWKLRRFKFVVGGACGLFLVTIILWRVTMRPSNDRVWQDDVAETPHATISGRMVTLHNVRYCLYRTETDYDVRYEDRNLDLDKLRYVDMSLTDWGLGAFAHTMFSFGFDDGQYVCFSIETRKEPGEQFSNIKGFFRQYELIYIAADERDLIGLRTNFRKGETVRLYRLMPRDPRIVEEVFLEYIERMNQLHERPEFYNAVTDNCMTSAYKNIRKHAPRARWDWRVFCNGYVDELAYEDGTLFHEVPFPDLKAAAVVNERAKAAAPSENFSLAIRRGIPGMTDANPSSVQ